jgi:cob(I)alamin adenosyltransferase
MPRITKVTTRTGDDGTTALGSGRRVPKSAPRIAAYGTIDELNAVLGVVLTSGVTPELVDPLRRIQNDLFHVGAELCIPEADRKGHPGPRIEARHVVELETPSGELNQKLPALKNFVLPGGTQPAAHLHVARTVCRRAEREMVALAAAEPVGPELIRYLNRLSDVLFVMARCQNQAAGAAEPTWDSRA